MGQLGFSEIIVIFIVALLVFGPKKLPELGKSLGKGIREFRKATNELKSTWEDQVRDIQAPLDEVKKDFNGMGQDLRTDFYNSIENSTESEPSAAASSAAATAATGTSTVAATSAATAEDSKESEDTQKASESSIPKEHV